MKRFLMIICLQVAMLASTIPVSAKNGFYLFNHFVNGAYKITVDIPDYGTVKSPQTLKTIEYNDKIVWRAGSTVTYNVGQGTGHFASDNSTAKNVFYIYGLPTLTPQTLDEENNTEAIRSDFATSNIIRNGYTWAGTWALAPNNTAGQSPALTTVEGTEDNPIYPTRSTGDDFTLYPVWNLNNYTISYDANKGSGSTNPSMPSNKTSYNVEDDAWVLTNPTRTGYQFIGWSGTGLTGSENMIVSITPSEELLGYGSRSYTANWEPNTYTIRFNQNGGTGGTDKTTITAIYDQNVVLADQGYKRGGQSNRVWGTSPTGGSTYTTGGTYKNLTSVDESTVDLYALYGIIMYYPSMACEDQDSDDWWCYDCYCSVCGAYIGGAVDFDARSDGKYAYDNESQALNMLRNHLIDPVYVPANSTFAYHIHGGSSRGLHKFASATYTGICKNSLGGTINYVNRRYSVY